MRAVLAFALSALLCGSAWAQQGVSVPPAAIDTSQFATTSALSALSASMPQPAAVVPPAEIVGGAAGTASTYRRGDAVQPRITRTKTITLDANGAGTFDWTSQGALTTPVQVVVSPVYSGSSVPKCWVTASSATSASVKCMLENPSAITLSIVTTGITLNSAANGMQVGIIVLPPS